MVLLAIGTGVLVARRNAAPSAEPSAELLVESTPAAATTLPAPAAAPPSTPVEVVPEVIPAAPPIVEAPKPAAQQAPPPVSPSEFASASQGIAPPIKAEADASPVETPTKIEPAAASEPSPGSAAPTPSAETQEAPPGETAAPVEAPKPALFRDQFEIVPARTKPGENGVTIYDERFPVKGAGTAEDPIEVPWEHLVSASETFQPRMGKKRLPERITMLDGKHVRVTGYVAFPIMAASQNEMLSMRNMWDGCCIGVPPTPYDALEVRLKEPATGKDRFTAFGTVEGTMKVDPYIKGNWLLGLYLMEDGRLTQLKEGGDPGKHGGM